MCRNTANNINFHYRINSVKICLNSIFFKTQDPNFWSIFVESPQFLEQNKFSPKTSALSWTTS